MNPLRIVLIVASLSLTMLALAERDSMPRLAVVSAFAPELEVLLAQTEVTGVEVINGRTFSLGRLEGNDVVLFLSGISMVNAAMTTQLALDHFTITGIVFGGIAGGVNPDLNIGDVTVPGQWAQYQEQFFAREVADGWDLGFYNSDEFGNFGMMFPKLVDVTRQEGEPDAVEKMFWFPVDSRMLEVAKRVAGQVELARCTAEAVCLEHAPTVNVGGYGVSGSTFVDNAGYREWVWENFEADALDMETAAVGHVAYANGVPYIAFRSLSDLAGGGPGENELQTFFTLAAENSAAFVTLFLRAWADLAQN